MPRFAEWLKVLTQYLITTKRFEQDINKVKPISFSNGKYKVEFDVTKDHLNMHGGFHEGLTTTLIDVISNHALCFHGNGYMGVSTNIHITHYQPALPGDVLLINAKVHRVEFPFAYVEVELSKKNGEEIVARGQHTLFIKPADINDFK